MTRLKPCKHKQKYSLLIECKNNKKGKSIFLDY